MKKTMLIVLLFALVLMAGCSGDKSETDGEEKARQAVAVSTAVIERGDLLRSLDYKGTVIPWRQANITPDVSGRVARIYKQPGDRVERGDLLAELDLVQIDLQLQQARAALAVASASRTDAEMQEKRLAALLEKDAVARMQHEKAQLALEAARTQYMSAQANLEMLNYIKSNSKMRAPFSGVITRRSLEEGDMINPAMGAGLGVLTLMDMSRVKVLIDVPAHEIEEIQIGQLCLVTVASLPRESFPGRVLSRNLAADPVSKSFRVEIEIENPELRIKPGVFADVAVETMKRSEVLLLPLKALLAGDQVFLYDRGTARKTAVKTGERNRDYVEVLSGLDPGTRVLVSGNFDLRDGSAVRIQDGQDENR